MALHAYLEPTRVTVQRMDAIADVIADGTGAVVTIGYGPRFLHSTGQLHKGGPAGGVFLQIVDRPQYEPTSTHGEPGFTSPASSAAS